MARRLAKEEGIFCGYSAGSCLQGLMQLKNKLKKDDLVVCIFHDHGSRYVAKIYNDQWMMERGFLDVKTFRDIVNARGVVSTGYLDPDQTVGEAVDRMKELHIENIPVVNDGIPVVQLVKAAYSILFLVMELISGIKKFRKLSNHLILWFLLILR